ncbi:MAG: VirB4 family type IV secretion system protein [Thermoprotei archaeon]
MNSLERPIEIYMVHQPTEIIFQDYKINYEQYEYYLKSYEDVGPLLENAGISYHVLLSSPFASDYYNHKKTIVMDGKHYATVVILRPPLFLVQGFFIEFIKKVSRIGIRVEPIDIPRSYQMLKMREKILSGKIAEAQSSGAPVDHAVLSEYQTVSEYLEQIQAREVRLFYATITLTVSGETSTEARKKAEVLKKDLESRGFLVDYPSYVQPLLYELKKPKIITDTLTLTGFYPLITTTLTDPGGTFLGYNAQDGSPVTLNIWLRKNYNIFVLGIPGAGKSMFGKVLLLRNLMQYPDLEYYIIDPENEFIPLLRATEGQIIEVREDRELGLDPIHLFPKYDAINIITMLTSIPPELKGELASLIVKADNIQELYKLSSKELKQYLVRLVEGPESFIFLGQPQDIKTKAGFCLGRILSSEVKRIISIMALAKIWNTIKTNVLNRRIIIVDEAWMFLNEPSVANFLAEISAGSRKKFSSLVLLTQQPQQVLATPIGKTLINNSATKLLLKQDINVIPDLAQQFLLEQWEQELLYKLETGQAYLLAEHIRLPVQITVTKDEYKLFTTKPLDLIENNEKT